MRLRALVVAAVALGACVAAGGASGLSGGAAAAPVIVRMGDFFYAPKTVTVRVGQTVRFLNVGKIEHTVADTDARGNVRSQLIRPRPLARGQAQRVRFARAGVVPYVCTFHPTLMRGRIVVRP